MRPLRTTSLPVTLDKKFQVADKAGKLAAQLDGKDADTRLRAADSLRRLVDGHDEAEAVAVHLRVLVRRLKDKDPLVKGAAIDVLRVLSEEGQALAVSTQIVDILDRLKDEEVNVRRKAVILCRMVVENGGAPIVARHVPRLVECLQANSPVLQVSPLSALKALVEAGEADAVARGALPGIACALNSLSSATRVLACEALGALATAGFGDRLRNWSPGRGASFGPVLDSLAVLVDDPDREARIACVHALECLVRADPESILALRERHFQRFTTAALQHMTDNEFTEALSEVLGQPLGIRGLEQLDQQMADRRSECVDVAPDAADTDDDSDNESLRPTCVICQRDLRRHGDVRTLPCCHTFHDKCVSGWMRRVGTCPVCRRSEHDPLFRSVTV
eukprot:gnl/TRDRNA2_/TRDRNA2_191675_c0_seq1.p1 gnl/TRDRNA2_/TRDRNA2_191675_c0~~gnl/TRDRNA2_/TRDRNA2_191675_c0_seq1.p1  ORF type:complete len:392 (+),score=45.54 gnl/TRDRNA2_/TRDRNA2_191675_c0_seq1:107-1282(+)